MVIEKSAPSKPRDAARKRLALAVLAGLLSPAKKFPDGKSRPVTLISGNREPRVEPPVGHTETVILRAKSSATILLKDTHGSLPWLRRVASKAFIASTDGWSLKGAGPLCRLPHSLLSAGAMFPKQSVHYFIKTRTQESSHATGGLHPVSALLWFSTHISAG